MFFTGDAFASYFPYYVYSLLNFILSFLELRVGFFWFGELCIHNHQEEGEEGSKELAALNLTFVDDA